MITCTGDPSEEASMPATNDRIRRTIKVERTRDDAGHKLTMEVVAYDNGVISVDGVIINNIKRDKEPAAHGWLGAAEVAVLTISEFRRQVEKRQKEQS
jgi:hypothetical protein